MQDNVLDTTAQNDPIYLQHLMWVLGQPSTWMTLFLFMCLLIGIFKMTKQLWQRKSWIWGLGFLLLISLALGYFTWLSVHAVEFYRQGRSTEFHQLSIAKLIVLGLSFASLVWIIIGRFRRHKSSGT